MIGGNQQRRAEPRGRRPTGFGPAALAIALVLVPALSGCVDLGEGAGAGTSTTVAAPAATDVPAPEPPPAPVPDPSVPATTTTVVIPEGAIDGVPPVPDAPASALVDRLVVAEPHAPSPYRRRAFGADWTYDRSTGCNTRELVLAEESGPGLVVDDRCKPLIGSWTSAYDGLATADPADLEIDHLVPLAEAWRTGAADWTTDRRRAFANDLDDPGTLQAVSSRSNRSKQDSTPERWLPVAPADRCRYVTDWVRVKHRWDLTVAPAEKAVLVQVLSGC